MMSEGIRMSEVFKKTLTKKQISTLNQHECGYCGAPLASGRCWYEEEQRQKRTAEEGDCTGEEMLLRGLDCLETVTGENVTDIRF